MSEIHDGIDVTLTNLVDTAAVADLPDLVGALATAQGRALARIATTATAPGEPQMDAEHGLLTIEQAAERLSVSTAWLYRHGRDLPFTKKLGHRTLRFDAKGLDRWSKSRPAA